jgi:hypothetical protein
MNKKEMATKEQRQKWQMSDCKENKQASSQSTRARERNNGILSTSGNEIKVLK